MRDKRTFIIVTIVAFAMLAVPGILQRTRLAEAKARLSPQEKNESREYDSLNAAITAARYEPSQANGNAIATNYANHIRGTFSPKCDVLESTSADVKWQTRWRLQSLGNGDDQLMVGEGEVQTEGDRVTIKHQISTPNGSAIVEEWFKNEPDGLENGFILPQRLSEGVGSLRLTIAIDGDLTPQADADGQDLRLVNKQGEAILNYEKLKVWDADGVEIAARMTTQNGAVILDVADAGARYPLVIDPTFSAVAKLVASDGAAGDAFGKSITISDNTAIVGAPSDTIGGNEGQGSAYIFVRGANGLWGQQAKLTAADGGVDVRFGYSVGISGDTVVVGSPGEVSGNGRGAAYVYVRNGTTWTAEEELTASDGAVGDNFGISVGIAGDNVIVGSYSDDVGGNTDQGSAYVFVRNGGAWTQQDKLTAEDGAGFDFFGVSAAIGINTAIVGAYLKNIGGNVDQGSAYIFSRSGTNWTQQQKLTASDGAAADEFGKSVDLAGGTDSVIVGAPKDNSGGISERGSAYVFLRTGTNWTQQQKLLAADGAPFDRFGSSVAIFSNTAIVGAPLALTQQGAAYIFARNGTTWTPRQKLTAFDGVGGAFFGTCVALSSDTAVVGANNARVNGQISQGAAYMFRLGSKPFDFDDDGKADISIYRPSNGQWWWQRSGDGVVPAFQFGTATDRIVPGDYTGDGKMDIGVWRPSTGFWYILRSEDFLLYGFPFGLDGDIPVPGDYDGDGKTDAAVFRPSTVTWYINKSSGGTVIQSFGAAGDKPVVADYDGDGKTDIAIFRPSNGQWWWQRSSDGVVPAFQFGTSTDRPVQGDYTGDGKADIAIWRPSTGFWYVLRSEDFLLYAFPWGISGDVPTPGDYDGDGKIDASVFRPSGATWFLNRSTAGVLIQQFGASTDTPVPSAFVP